MSDYSALSDDDLRSKYKELSKEVAKYNNFQMAKKILMNSLYGAMGNNGFRFFDPRVAEGITMTGQFFIRSVGDAIDAYIAELMRDPNLKSTYYQDTDSVAGDTLIYVNGERIRIDRFYDSVTSSPVETKSGVSVKLVSGASSCCSFDGSSVDTAPIQYVMKHTVQKRMYTIKVDGKSVKVTEDHSLMVIRDGKLTETTVSGIIAGDKLVSIR